MKFSFKSILVYAWEWLYLRGAFPSLQKNTVIFMLHRMVNPDTPFVNGHSAEFLDDALNYLCRKGYNFVSLEDVYNNIEKGGLPLKKAIAFTIDDGFIDQAKVAAPIFIKYKCPVTIFLITEFVDGGAPPWDAIVKHIFNKTDQNKITVKLNSKVITYDISDSEKKYSAMNEFRSKCKDLPELELKEAIEYLKTISGLGSISFPISDAQALSWDDALELEKFDVSFAPHTSSHTILSNCSDRRAREEITGSWGKLIQKLKKPCPIFAYPNGRKQDFTVRDINYIKETEMQGAVMSEPGYVEFGSVTEADKYLIKRMSFPTSLERLIQYSSGLEYVKQKVDLFLQDIKYAGKVKTLVDIMLRVKFYFGIYNRYENIDWERVSRLIFVCKGNICRSPYAEARAKQLGINAISIGLHTKEGSAANVDAINNALYRDIDLGSHKACIYESIEIASSDLVIGMEPWHVDYFKAIDNSDCQVTLLGLWCSRKRIIVSDPYSKSDMFFEDSFQVLDNALDNIKNNFNNINK
jgi:protein-tyrosine-phosphatase/peptidoglycan/xylan/chitin deacetylase (PgdA/CDA1 family)